MNMLEEINSLHTETIVLLVALTLALVNALVAALRTESWVSQGKRAMVKQDFLNAIHYFTQEILSNPEKPEAYTARAEAYRKSGEVDKANQDQSKADQLFSLQGEQKLSTSLW